MADLMADQEAAPDSTNNTDEPIAAADVVDPIVADCQRLADQLAAYGLSVNFGGAINLGDLKPAIEANAAGTLLMMKGIVTPEEWHDVVHGLLREVLANVLQSAEEQRLVQASQAAKSSRLAVPERPRLAIARG